MTNLVIGVGGRLTAGKDVFADHLVEQHGFVKLGMSDTLAEALYRLNPYIDMGSVKHLIDPEWVELFSTTSLWRYKDLVDNLGYVKVKTHPEVRRLLQVLGTEVGRELLGENIWVEAARRRIQDLTGHGRDVVITGVRFPNEVELFNSWLYDDNIAATTVFVTRPGLPPATHASETSVQLEDFEYELKNTGSLEDLTIASSQLLRTIEKDYL